MKAYAECRLSEEHAEHMAVNDECPWCGAYRERRGAEVVVPS
jgi:hypothetical protein